MSKDLLQELVDYTLELDKRAKDNMVLKADEGMLEGISNNAVGHEQSKIAGELLEIVKKHVDVVLDLA
jgi:hypothetical protein